ncbi:MAG: LysM peptidoglycan-binding domain-containing protein [Chthoniobacterales bacterium]|nr:LysM peptidoglycan-binding domain-containing protein [Chthoniobacterales bacterium]
MFPTKGEHNKTNHLKKFHQSFYSLLLAVFFFPLTSCEKLSSSHSQSRFEDAARALQIKDYNQAIRIYESLLSRNEAAAEAHYHLAVIYETHLKEPFSAYHHYQQYLKLANSQKHTEEVNKSIQRLQEAIATRLNESGLISKEEAIRIRNENNQLRKEIAQLREQLINAKRSSSHSENTTKTKLLLDKSGFSKIPQTREAEKAVGTETRTYTVQKGDTLASISRKFYKTTARWKDIADANFNQLQGNTNLREGQILIIP